jgi:hypothetical protein
MMASSRIAWEQVAPGSALDRLRRFTAAELRRKSVADPPAPSRAEGQRGTDDRRQSRTPASGTATPSKPEDPS